MSQICIMFKAVMMTSGLEKLNSDYIVFYFEWRIARSSHFEGKWVKHFSNWYHIWIKNKIKTPLH